MKAVMKINQKNDTWDTMMPPLVSLKDINNNNNIKIIFKLLEEMENLSFNSWMKIIIGQSTNNTLYLRQEY